MWPFKKKIKIEPKSRLYGNRYSNQSYSTWDNLSLIEKIVLFLGPIGLTFIDCMVLEAMFGLGLWANIIISAISTVILMVLLWWFATWMTEE